MIVLQLLSTQASGVEGQTTAQDNSLIPQGSPLSLVGMQREGGKILILVILTLSPAF